MFKIWIVIGVFANMLQVILAKQILHSAVGASENLLSASWHLTNEIMNSTFKTDFKELTV
jgi:hypothetical protein